MLVKQDCGGAKNPTHLVESQPTCQDKQRYPVSDMNNQQVKETTPHNLVVVRLLGEVVDVLQKKLQAYGQWRDFGQNEESTYVLSELLEILGLEDRDSN